MVPEQRRLHAAEKADVSPQSSMCCHVLALPAQSMLHLPALACRQRTCFTHACAKRKILAVHPVENAAGARYARFTTCGARLVYMCTTNLARSARRRHSAAARPPVHRPPAARARRAARQSRASSLGRACAAAARRHASGRGAASLERTRRWRSRARPQPDLGPWPRRARGALRLVSAGVAAEIEHEHACCRYCWVAQALCNTSTCSRDACKRVDQPEGWLALCGRPVADVLGSLSTLRLGTCAGHCATEVTEVVQHAYRFRSELLISRLVITKLNVRYILWLLHCSGLCLFSCAGRLSFLAEAFQALAPFLWRLHGNSTYIACFRGE
jgi:hypothetical protein